MTRIVLPFKLALASLLFAACVTINVYFPAEAAEQAADRIIDQVQGAEAKAPPQTRAKPVQAKPDDALRTAAASLIGMLFPAAHAQSSANLDISSPEIRAITASMQQRFGALNQFLGSGAVGLTANGLVEIRDQNAIPLAERANARRIVSEENNDRNALYKAIANANNHPEWADDIQATFARRWIERAPAGTWVQSGGGWKQK